MNDPLIIEAAFTFLTSTVIDSYNEILFIISMKEFLVKIHLDSKSQIKIHLNERMLIQRRCLLEKMVEKKFVLLVS